MLLVKCFTVPEHQVLVFSLENCGAVIWVCRTKPLFFEDQDLKFP